MYLKLGSRLIFLMTGVDDDDDDDDDDVNGDCQSSIFHLLVCSKKRRVVRTPPAEALRPVLQVMQHKIL